jgi:hypothetical protein
MIALLIGALALQPAYSWNVIAPGETVQYGIPQTDDRAIRIDCRPDGRLVILGPSGVDLPENVPTRVTFRRGTEAVTLLGVTAYMGDGMNFEVPVAAGELPIATLLAGAPLTLVHGDSTWEVPGAGAPAVLGPLVEACRPT